MPLRATTSKACLPCSQLMPTSFQAGTTLRRLMGTSAATMDGGTGGRSARTPRHEGRDDAFPNRLSDLVFGKYRARAAACSALAQRSDSHSTAIRAWPRACGVGERMSGWSRRSEHSAGGSKRAIGALQPLIDALRLWSGPPPTSSRAWGRSRRRRLIKLPPASIANVPRPTRGARTTLSWWGRCSPAADPEWCLGLGGLWRVEAEGADSDCSIPCNSTARRPRRRGHAPTAPIGP